jgi:hypothetical protein
LVVVSAIQTVTEDPVKEAGEVAPIAVKAKGVIRAYTDNDVVRVVVDLITLPHIFGR